MWQEWPSANPRALAATALELAQKAMKIITIRLFHEHRFPKNHSNLAGGGCGTSIHGGAIWAMPFDNGSHAPLLAGRYEKLRTDQPQAGKRIACSRSSSISSGTCVILGWRPFVGERLVASAQGTTKIELEPLGPNFCSKCPPRLLVNSRTILSPRPGATLASADPLSTTLHFTDAPALSSSTRISPSPRLKACRAALIMSS